MIKNMKKIGIVYPENAGNDFIKAVCAFKNRLEKITGEQVTLWGDNAVTDAQYVICVGETNDPLTQGAREKLSTEEKENVCVIKFSENKIALLGKSEALTTRAMKYFVLNFDSIYAEKESDNLIFEVNTDTFIFNENLVEFSMGDENIVYHPFRNVIKDENFVHRKLQYPTAVYLRYQKNESDNGVIIATLNSGEAFYRILKSVDDGKNWSEITKVYETNPKNSEGSKPLIAGRMPYLFELPADVGELKKGTLILSGTSSPVNGTKSDYEGTAIAMYYSTDIGETWNYLPSVDYGEGKIDGNGVWEPFLIYEEETKRVYCFYSDATEDPVEGQHDQRLVYKYSTDMKTWIGLTGSRPTDEPFEAVASENCRHRPGMIAVSKMNNGKYIMTYEFVGSRIDKTHATMYCKIADKLDDWGNPADVGCVIRSEEGETAGSGPFSAYTSIGGDNGMFFAFARFRGDYDFRGKDVDSNLNAPDIFISFDCGNTYTLLKNPFGYIHTRDIKKDRTGYSVMLLVSPDGRSVYFFNNPPYEEDLQYISMIRMKIIE